MGGEAISPPLQDVVQELLSPQCDLLQQDLGGKRILMRVDFNVPSDDHACITDTSRIDAALPTVRHLLMQGAKVILASHFGRPDPKTQTLEDMRAQFSLAPVSAYLKRVLGEAAFIGLVPDCIGSAAERASAALLPGQACLLENTRFHFGDTANSDEFAWALAAHADVFVNDAFGVVHRDQGSVTAITKFLPECYPGPLMRKELQNLAGRMYNPVRPLGVVLGGAKVADKIGVINSLIDFADMVMVGGRMAFTFLAAVGVAVGQTQVEAAWMEPCRSMIQRAKDRGVQLLLPHDVLVSSSLEAAEDTRIVPLTVDCCTAEAPCIPPHAFGIDIGPSTTKAFAEHILQCGTVFWNGPMGKFEIPEFAKGTLGIAEAMDLAATRGCITIIGGGDSVAAVNAAGLAQRITHISTGGGASLELLEGKHMPGLRALVAARVAGSRTQ